MVIHYPAKFGGHRHCGSGDTMALVYHVILKEHMTKRWNNSMGRINVLTSHHPNKFSGHRHSASGDIMFEVGHLIKGSCEKVWWP